MGRQTVRNSDVLALLFPVDKSILFCVDVKYYSMLRKWFGNFSITQSAVSVSVCLILLGV